MSTMKIARCMIYNDKLLTNNLFALSNCALYQERFKLQKFAAGYSESPGVFSFPELMVLLPP